MNKPLEQALAILNGALGDYLARTRNGLATTMSFVDRGEPLRLERRELLRVHPNPSRKVVVLAHGLMCTEEAWRFPDGSDYGARLAAELGYTPLYLRYNSGLPVASNGELLAALLERLVAEYPEPIEELLPLGYSMGGLVVRSATHMASLASQRWLTRVRRAIYIATPHLGAPLERAGRTLVRLLGGINDPYTRLIAEIADLRSAGVKDLGDARLTPTSAKARDEELLTNARHPVPLLPDIQHYLLAGSFWIDPHLLPLFGDALVPIASATHGACRDRESRALPPSHVRVFPGVHHLALARDPSVYEEISKICREEGSSCPSNAGEA